MEFVEDLFTAVLFLQLLLVNFFSKTFTLSSRKKNILSLLGRHAYTPNYFKQRHYNLNETFLRKLNQKHLCDKIGNDDLSVLIQNINSIKKVSKKKIIVSPRITGLVMDKNKSYADKYENLKTNVILELEKDFALFFPRLFTGFKVHIGDSYFEDGLEPLKSKMKEWESLEVEKDWLVTENYKHSSPQEMLQTKYKQIKR
jgi:hypothetical protein